MEEFFIVRRFLIAGVSMLLPIASAALADDIKMFDAKPGLWESTTTTQMEGVAMPAMPNIPKETLDKMPPAQRAQVESMMKNRGGAGGPMTSVSKNCQTLETMRRGFASDNKQSSCTRQVTSATPAQIQIHMECSSPNGGKSTGDMVMHRQDAEHVTGNMTLKTISGDKTINMKMTIASKWISSDCGDVKPYTGQ